MKSRKKGIAKIIFLAIMTVTLLTNSNIVDVKGDLSPDDLTVTDSEVGYVNVSTSLRMRAEPSLNSKILYKFKPGDILTILEEDNDFYLVAFGKGNNYKSGWVYKEYVVIPEKSDKDCDLLSAAVITASGSSEDRNYNMSLACEKLNGLTLEPEEEFDWYGEKGVGQASKKNGFRQAPVIENGKTVTGYGGGVCQVSTALYNCIYDLGIEPTEIHHHSITPTYVEKGMDATVASSAGKSFCFTNTKEYTIEFEAFTEGGRVIILAYKVDNE